MASPKDLSTNGGTTAEGFEKATDGVTGRVTGAATEEATDMAATDTDISAFDMGTVIDMVSATAGIMDMGWAMDITETPIGLR